MSESWSEDRGSPSTPAHEWPGVGFNKIMQSSGQYHGVSDPPQFAVGRPPPHNIFGLSAHDHHVSMSLQSPSGVAHAGAHVVAAPHQHPQSQHQHALQQHLQLSHQGTLHSHNVRPQSHQSPSPPAPAAVSYPHPGKHSQQQQQQQQQTQNQQPSQQVQPQQNAQQQLVHQLGLASGPDSPDAAPSPIGSRLSPASFSNKQIVPAARDVDEEGMDDEGRGTGGNRWPRRETLALIKIRSEMDSNFRDSGLKGPLWDDVSRKLADLGFQRSAKKCKEKFENIHKYYKKTKDGRAGRQDGKTYRFFSELEAIYGGQHSSAAPLNVGPDRGNAAVQLLMGTGGNAPGLVDGPSMIAQRTADRTAELSASGLTLTDSSEDDYDLPGGGAGDNHDSSKKKRKRFIDGKLSSSNSKLKSLELVVKNLIDKQEAMQRKFLEAIEKREQERMVREEAAKRQEMARLTRDHELRAQQHALAASRDAALVAFLQKVTGPTLQLPQIMSAPAAPLVATPAPHVRPTVTVETHHDQSQSEERQEKEGSLDPNGKRWPKPEVNDLIRLRSGMETRFQEAGPKAPLWEEISSGMSRLGYNRNAKRCKEKWENINKYFRKTKESNKQRPENAKTCPYFHQLDTLYRQGVLTPTSKGNKLAGQSEAQHGSDHEHLESHPIPASVAGERDNAHAQPDAQILSILPATTPAEGVGTTAASTGTNNGGATAEPAHFFSSPDDGSSADRGPIPPKKGVMQQLTLR